MPASIDVVGVTEVARGWRAERGMEVPGLKSLYIGKRFGHGFMSMNSIYDIVDKSGKSAGYALKVCKQTLAARRSLAHEWKMFKDLALLGERYPAASKHFLQAHGVLVHEDDKTIVAIVMEKANGKNVVKRLEDPRFHDAKYVLQLLHDVVVALDVAQRELGFVHYDLKLDNVMEHWPHDSPMDPPDMCDCNTTTEEGHDVPTFKIFDFGTAVVYPDPFSAKSPMAADNISKEDRHGKPGVVADSPASEGYEYSQPFCMVRIYHMVWKQRGDVYRVLRNLYRLLDKRTWPVEDAESVNLLMKVLQQAIGGKKAKVKFMPRDVLQGRRPHRLVTALSRAVTWGSGSLPTTAVAPQDKQPQPKAVQISQQKPAHKNHVAGSNQSIYQVDAVHQTGNGLSNGDAARHQAAPDATLNKESPFAQQYMSPRQGQPKQSTAARCSPNTINQLTNGSAAAEAPLGQSFGTEKDSDKARAVLSKKGAARGVTAHEVLQDPLFQQLLCKLRV